MVLFGFHQLLEEGVFSGAACSEFRQLGLGGCSSDLRLRACSSPWEMTGGGGGAAGRSGRGSSSMAVMGDG